jgi:MoaA/NifB/PqqE/SkfB family radical SAM enzyme
VYKLTNDIIKKNGLDRFFIGRRNVCNAPFISLNFDSTGLVTACCANRKHILGKYPENSIHEIWYGEKIAELRAALNSFDFSKGCQLCFNRINEGSIQNSQLSIFNKEGTSHNVMPLMMELEISTICNYECIMCGGKWSSSIRKNREKLPPLSTPYNDAFIDDIRPYARNLEVIKLLGGEPFATPIYYKLIDMLYEINKKIEIVITTNGSIFNQRIRNILERGQHISLCFSIDSLDENTYSFIRKNGNLKNVLSNFYSIKDIENQGTRIIDAVAFCPMIQNWREIPNMIQFCQQNSGLKLHFNHVTGPLGGRVQGLHDSTVAKQSVIYSGQPTQKIVNTVVLDEKIPEVSLFTLSYEERQDIAAFLEQSIKKERQEYREPVLGLINSLTSVI